MNLGNAVAVMAGGAIGAGLRYILTLAVQQRLISPFPYGTLTVNILGSFAIGVLHVLLVERSAASPIVHSLLTIGLLGSFTTFSTLSLEILQLIRGGYSSVALAYVAASVILGLLAAWVGLTLASHL